MCKGSDAPTATVVSGIVPTATRGLFAIVTSKDCVTLRPPGSVAVTFTESVPFIAAVIVSVLSPAGMFGIIISVSDNDLAV